MSRIARPTLFILVLLVALCGCAGDPNPFTVSIRNDGAATFFFRGETQPDPDLYVEWDGDWDLTGSAGESGCYRPCGHLGTDFCPGSVTDFSTFALLPGDSAVFESPGEAFQPRRDASGECRGDTPLVGSVRVELCYGEDAISQETATPLEPAKSGSVGDAEFDVVDCATAEIDLPDQDEMTLPLP